MKVCVIGRGLIGSAAARHLAKAGHDVVLVGPDEPADKTRHTGVFASHYDEGRITRKNALDPWWVDVTAKAIGRYREIEAASDIPFFTECGAMMAGAAPWMARVEVGRIQHKVDCEVLDADALRQNFPYFDFPADFTATYEPTQAGHISPRALVRAQTTAAKRLGACVVTAEVTKIGERFCVADGQRIEADQILVAAGAWSDTLLGGDPILSVYARTVALFEIDEAMAAALRSMPSLVYDTPEDPYLLPPIQYPDGKLYVKLGGDPEDVPLYGAKEIGDWFRNGGNPQVRDHLVDMLHDLMPTLRVQRVHMNACVTSWTPDRKPKIARLSPTLSVCTGGNGAGAKCSDELGRLGAEIAIGLR